jgi:hypothetical protein
MMPQITVKPVAAQMERLRDVLRNFPHAFEVAAQSSITRTVEHGQTSIADLLYKEVNLKRGRISDTIRVTKPDLRNLVGYITMSEDKLVWLIEYLKTTKQHSLIGRWMKGKKPTRLDVQVRKLHPLTRYSASLRHAFLAFRSPSSYPGIFERTGVFRKMTKGRYKGKVRETIHRMQGPSPLTVFRRGHSDKADTLLNEALADLDAWMLKVMVSKTEWILGGGKYMTGRVAQAFKD